MSLVLGSYDLGVPQESKLYNTILYSLSGGIHYLDTAPNYYDGKAERIIGKALDAFSLTNKEIRNQVKIFSKYGLLNQSRDRFYGDDSRVDMWRGPDFDFSIERLANSVEKSITELGVGQLECLFIHNPEVVCAYGYRAMDVCKGLVRPLQEIVRRQLIRSWGISSWFGFYASPDEPSYISLRDLLAHARAICDNVDFKFIQVPFGLWNLNEAMQNNQQNAEGKWVATVESAHSHGLQIAVNSMLRQGEVKEICYPIEDLPLISHSMSEAEKQLVFCKSYSDADFFIVGMNSKRSVDMNLRIFGSQ